MLADAKPVCFVLTADLPKARAFYSDTLGLTETGEDPFASLKELLKERMAAKGGVYDPLPVEHALAFVVLPG